MPITNETIEKLVEIGDRKEQYSRRNCLLLHGITDNEAENTDDFVLRTANEKMNIELSSSDLDRTHRVSQKNGSNRKSRAVIVKFVSYITRKQLKSRDISIIENLTAKRIKM